MLHSAQGYKVSGHNLLEEGYRLTSDVSFESNVDADKIIGVLQHYIVMHDEPMFFILELPASFDKEQKPENGILQETHTEIYYIDGCTVDECLVLLDRFGDLLINDGMSEFGFGCHSFKDEIMVRKYNIITIYAKDTDEFEGFFEAHEIEKKDGLITAWNTFTPDSPGECSRYICKEKSVYDIPEMLKDWGIYLAETRTNVVPTKIETANSDD